MLIRNLFTALLISSIFWLNLYPYRIRQQIESDIGFPSHLEVFYVAPFASEVATTPQKIMIAQQILNQSLGESELAAESGFIELSGELPKIYVSKSMVDLELIEIRQGEVIDQVNYLIAQEGGPYKQGEMTAEGEVSALATLKWQKLFLHDAAVIQLIQNDLAKIPALIRKNTTFYLSSNDYIHIQEILEAIQHYTGMTYAHEPLYNFLAKDSYALELRQATLQKLSVTFLAFSLLLSIFSHLSQTWYKGRENYRIERVLGRSSYHYFRTWFLQSIHQWLWGLLVSTAIFTIFIVFGKNSVANLKTLMFWFLGFFIVSFILTFLVSSSASQFPLSRSSLDVEQTWRDQLVPIFTTIGLVFGITFLFADTLSQWLESQDSIKSLGANTFIATTTSAATDLLDANICKHAQSKLCSRFGITNIPLWPTELSQLSNDDTFISLIQFDPQQAKALDIKLVQGRFPTHGKREIAINESIMTHIHDIMPDFGLGSKLDAGYEVVGFVRTPTKAKFSIFDSIYQVPAFIAPNAPDILPEYFLPPLGKSGVILQLNSTDDPIAIKQNLRNIYKHLSFTQPASYALYFERAIRKSATILGFIFLLAFLLAIMAYYSLINTLLQKRMLELAIWRLMGMNMATLRCKLIQILLYTPIISGLLGLIAGYWLLIITNRKEVLPYALVCAFTITTLLVVICFFMIYQKTSAISKQEINQAYREVL
jgi:hypothetical protein